MEPIFTMTALQRSPSQVKKAADNGLVRITDQGSGAYVFCGEEAFERLIARVREEAAYEARLVEAIGRGVSDIENGRYYDSVDEAFEAAAKMRQQYA